MHYMIVLAYAKFSNLLFQLAQGQRPNKPLARKLKYAWNAITSHPVAFAWPFYVQKLAFHSFDAHVCLNCVLYSVMRRLHNRMHLKLGHCVHSAAIGRSLSKRRGFDVAVDNACNVHCNKWSYESSVSSHAFRVICVEQLREFGMVVGQLSEKSSVCHMHLSHYPESSRMSVPGMCTRLSPLG